MPSKLTTHFHKVHSAKQILESISEIANTSYYIFAANHVPRSSNTVPELLESPENIVNDPYRNMIFGKEVTSNDVSLVIRNIPYEANVVYEMWDHENRYIYDEDFYVVVNASSYFHVFKCLDNNMEAESTIEPNFAHVTGANTEVYQTADGYRWKYMYSVSSTTKGKFGTDDYFPVVANNTVSNAATDGSIDIIKIDGVGSSYHNYVTGAFFSSDIHISGNPLLYSVSNSSINHTNGFYTGCLLYLSSGTGSGQYSTITDYYSNANGNYITVAEEFDVIPTNGTEFEIYPEVRVEGNGRNLVNVVARALVNSLASNSIYRVEILERGLGYDYATANVIANSVLQIISPAIVRPILGPYGGHGFDAATELNSREVMFSCTFANSESNTIPTSSIFQQIGIMRDPIFWDVDVEISSSNGVFIENELIYQIAPVRVQTNGTINTTSARVTMASADFVNQFSAGDYIYLKASNGTSHMISTVNNVVNSSVLNLSTNGYWACTETMIYKANVGANAVFSQTVNSSIISLNYMKGKIFTDDILVGNSSGAHAVVNSVIRSGMTKGFSTFVQTYQYDITSISGTFDENEYVYQGSSYEEANSSAILHSTANINGTTYMFTTNQFKDFEEGGIIYGANSLSSATINNKYNPELVVGSGDILFIENVSSVNRLPDQTETLRIVFSF